MQTRDLPERHNWSTIKHIEFSPKEYRHKLTVPHADTPAMRLGRITHTAVYEPEKLVARYIVQPNFHRGMKDDTAISKGYDGGKDAALEWDAQLEYARSVDPKIEFALQTEIDAAQRMRDALFVDPISEPFFTSGRAEQQINWTDPVTGLLCTGRVDHINGSLSDLKTTAMIHPRAVRKQIGSMRYHGQLAYYYDGLRAGNHKMKAPPALIFVQSVAPHDVLVLEVGERELDEGRRIYRYCLDTLAECLVTDNWPGVGGGKIQKLELAPWDYGVEEETLMVGGEAVRL